MSESNWVFILVYCPVYFVGVLVRRRFKGDSITESLKQAFSASFFSLIGLILAANFLIN